MLREQVRLKTTIGLRAARHMNAGELVPDALVLEIVTRKIGECAGKNSTGFVLHGFPRTRRQAEVLDGLLAAQTLRISHVVHIAVVEDVLMERVAG
jgi:adenylate kinase